MTDKLVKAIAYNGQIRATAIDASQVVQEAHERHDTWSAATAALGRTLVGTLMLASDIKDDAKMTVQISGDGPAGKIVTTADGSGTVKGYIDQPHISLAPNNHGKIDVRGAVGTSGVFSVIKDLGLKEPFSGQVPLISGEIAEDFTYYLTVSEQTPSAVALGVLVDTDENVLYAGGWMVQVMPGAEDETIGKLEKAIAAMPQVTRLLQDGLSPEQILEHLFGQDEVKILDERNIAFHCDCSKERFAAGLSALGDQQLGEIIEEDGQAETVCHFCNNKYHYTKEELETILTESNS